MENPHIYKTKKGNILSVHPPQTFLTFGSWIYMVPQYKPKNILMLGFAYGTVAGLIRLIWGDVPITAVDIMPCEDNYGANFIQAEAKEFVKKCQEFDAVIVDLFDNDTDKVCDFVIEPEFVANLGRIGNYLIVHSRYGVDMSVYKRFRKIGINKASESLALIYYYETKGKIPNLHPHK